MTLVIRFQILTIINEGSVTPAAESKKRQASGEPMKKKRKAEDRSPPTSVTLEDIGGVDNVIQQLGDALIMPLLMPEEYTRRRLSPPRGILLHGPPGCANTVISRSFDAKIDVPFVQKQGPSIVTGMSGESEQKVRELFVEARRLAPCLLFIDEIDVIAPKRDSSQSQMEKRIVAQMLLSLDALALD
jgi:ribosome biogenesis ATPase